MKIRSRGDVSVCINILQQFTGHNHSFSDPVFCASVVAAVSKPANNVELLSVQAE